MLTLIKSGILEVWRWKKILWTWYGLSLLCGLLIVAPVVAALGAYLDTSLENSRLFENFDLSLIVEFGWNSHWAQLPMWLPVLGTVAAAFVLLTTWMSGGFLAVLHDPEESFFAGCARWFPPLIRLASFSLIGHAVAFLVRIAVNALIRKVWSDSMSEQPSAYGGMIGFVLFCLVLLFVNLLTDYAKIHMVTHADRVARRGLKAGVRFVAANFKNTVTLYLILTGCGLMVWRVYHGVSEVLGEASMTAVVVLFVLRQIYVWSRIWLRLVFLASERAYFLQESI